MRAPGWSRGRLPYRARAVQLCWYRAGIDFSWDAGLSRSQCSALRALPCLPRQCRLMRARSRRASSPRTMRSGPRSACRRSLGPRARQRRRALRAADGDDRRLCPLRPFEAPRHRRELWMVRTPRSASRRWSAAGRRKSAISSRASSPTTAARRLGRCRPLYADDLADDPARRLRDRVDAARRLSRLPYATAGNIDGRPVP